MQSPVRARPSELIFLPGADFEQDDKVVYLRLRDTAQPLRHPQMVPSKSTASSGLAEVVAFATPQSATTSSGITALLPHVLDEKHPYALWVVRNGTVWSNGIRLNDARPLWFAPDRAFVSRETPGLSRQVKVVGRNLQPLDGKSTKVRLRGPATYVLTANEDRRDSAVLEHYVARVGLPARLKEGSYVVEVQRDGVAWVELPDQRFQVLADPRPTQDVQVAQFGCRGDDQADDTACVVAAVAAAGAQRGNVVFGAGSWRLGEGSAPGVQWRAGIVVPPYVHLIGASPESRIIKRSSWTYAKGRFVQRSLFTLTGGNVVAKLTFEDQQPHRPERMEGALFMLAGGDHTDDVTFTDNTFLNVYMAIANGGRPVRRFRATHNRFRAYSTAIVLDGYSWERATKFQVEDSIISHNLFKPGGYIDACIHQGTMATSIGATLRNDFSDNVADGRDTGAQDGLGLGNAKVPGWRAAFFWQMNGSHEMGLVTGNSASCTGDRAGDGEGIAFDSNHNTFAFDRPKIVAAASTDSVVVSTADGHALNVAEPSDYYARNGHWVQVAEGPGLGQARRIQSYSADPLTKQLTLVLASPWDVTPVPGSSVVTVGREYWQMHVVENTIDNRGCHGERNANGIVYAGGIVQNGMTVDSNVEGNRQYAAGGIQLYSGYSEMDAGHMHAALRHFQEVRGNLIDGEPDYASGCSWAGIQLAFGLAGGTNPKHVLNRPVVAGYGLSIVDNTIIHADALRGGGIAFSDAWHCPAGAKMYVNTLVQSNKLIDLRAAGEKNFKQTTNSQCEAVEGIECPRCRPKVGIPCGEIAYGDRANGAGINISRPQILRTVLRDNQFRDVDVPVVDKGTDTVRF